jgi:hypothetical protein
VISPENTDELTVNYEPLRYTAIIRLVKCTGSPTTTRYNFHANKQPDLVCSVCGGYSGVVISLDSSSDGSSVMRSLDSGAQLTTYFDHDYTYDGTLTTASSEADRRMTSVAPLSLSLNVASAPKSSQWPHIWTHCRCTL